MVIIKSSSQFSYYILYILFTMNTNRYTLQLRKLLYIRNMKSYNMCHISSIHMLFVFWSRDTIYFWLLYVYIYKKCKEFALICLIVIYNTSLFCFLFMRDHEQFLIEKQNVSIFFDMLFPFASFFKLSVHIVKPFIATLEKTDMNYNWSDSNYCIMSNSWFIIIYHLAFQWFWCICYFSSLSSIIYSQIIKFQL